MIYGKKVVFLLVYWAAFSQDFAVRPLTKYDNLYLDGTSVISTSPLEGV